MKRSMLFPLLIVLLMSSIVRGQKTTKEQKVNPSHLPVAVSAAIRTNCPNCVINKATREVENGVMIYDFEFKHGQGEMDVTQNGFVVSRETVINMDDAPAAVRDAIRKGASDSKVAQVSKEEIRAELMDGRVIKLDRPKYLYEADLVKGGRGAEIVVSPDGHVIEAPVWRKRH